MVLLQHGEEMEMENPPRATATPQGQSCLLCSGSFGLVSHCPSPAAPPQASWDPLTITKHMAAARALLLHGAHSGQGLSRRLKKLKKTQTKTGPTPNVGTVGFRARIKNRDIWIYCTGERQPWSVHAGPALYTLSTRSCATSDTLCKKKNKINTTMCLKKQ